MRRRRRSHAATRAGPSARARGLRSSRAGACLGAHGGAGPCSARPTIQPLGRPGALMGVQFCLNACFAGPQALQQLWSPVCVW